MENKNCIAAIDLGSSYVVVAAGSKDPSGKVQIEDIVIKPSRGVVAGEVKNVELAAQSIRDAVSELEDKLSIEIKEAYTGISGSHIKCAKHPYYVYVAGNDGEISESDVKRLNDSMRNVQAPDGHALLHIIPQHYIVNQDEEVADPVGMFGKTLGSTFNLIIGENNIVSRLDKAFQKVGIRKAGMMINALVSAEAVTFPDEKDLGVAVVDMGAGTTDICIYQDGIVRYVGVIPMGSDSINKDIRSYGIMERYVEELKTKYGSAVADKVDADKLIKVPGRTPHDHKEISFRNLASIIEARMLDIVEYVNEEIKNSGYEGKLGAGIILTGGSALLADVKELVQAKTGMDVRIAVPMIPVCEECADIVSDPRYSAAVGILSDALGSQGVSATATVKPRKEVGKETPKEPAPAAGREVFKPIRKEQPIQPEQQPQPEEDDDRPQQDVQPREQKKKKGFMQKLKERFEKTFDFDVLDDDSTI